jgi:molybdopterin molybdotransferase
MRAHMADGIVTSAPSQDSALLGVLASANALLIRPPHEPARRIGDAARVMLI